jgi:hypothetical protein
MKKITLKLLEGLSACSTAIEWFISKDTNDTEVLFEKAIKDRMEDEIAWILARLVNKKQASLISLFVCEMILRDGDSRAKETIDILKAYIKKPTSKTKSKACDLSKKTNPPFSQILLMVGGRMSIASGLNETLAFYCSDVRKDRKILRYAFSLLK